MKNKVIDKHFDAVYVISNTIKERSIFRTALARLCDKIEKTTAKIALF